MHLRFTPPIYVIGSRLGVYVREEHCYLFHHRELAELFVQQCPDDPRVYVLSDIDTLTHVLVELLAEGINLAWVDTLYSSADGWQIELDELVDATVAAANA